MFESKRILFLEVVEIGRCTYTIYNIDIYYMNVILIYFKRTFTQININSIKNTLSCIFCYFYTKSSTKILLMFFVKKKKENSHCLIYKSKINKKTIILGVQLNGFEMLSEKFYNIPIQYIDGLI